MSLGHLIRGLRRACSYWQQRISQLYWQVPLPTEAKSGNEKVHSVRSADELLHSGIADYTFIPGEEGVLGRGKFSTVYKVKDSDGQHYALKHTPLYPHHPLIAARLLREPTLLAQIPPHPCLIGVHGWIKTRDHFYLVEDLSKDHISLADIPTPVQNIGLARKILDQLVSVVRDGLHEGGRVCHRDLKTENILINDHGDLILLDLGLATRFSASSPKLTTCCGSPAFHSPEIIRCLNSPPGSYTYYGPELDIWCIGLTLLSLLTGRQYPIGTSHKYLDVMAQSAAECVQELRHISHCHRSRSRSSVLMDSDVERMQLESDWQIVFDAITGFLQINGNSRMLAFRNYKLDDCIKQHVAAHKHKVRNQRFKTVSFEPSPLKYKLPMSFDALPEDLSLLTGETSVRMRNLCMAPAFKVHSYIKYLLRSTQSKSADQAMTPDRHCIRFWIKVCCESDTADPTISPAKDTLLAPTAPWVPPFFSDLVGQNRRPSPVKRAVSHTSPAFYSPAAPPVPSIPDTRRKRSSSQYGVRLGIHTAEQLDLRFISLHVSDGRCLETLVEAIQSSQTQGLLSPHPVIGDLDIDDRDEAIQEAMRVREKAAAYQPDDNDAPTDRNNASGMTTKGLNLHLSGSYYGSHIPSSRQGDSDEEEENSILIKTPVSKDECDTDDERASRSKEKRGFSHIVKSRAEHPDIQITPVNAFYYERAHSASPARFNSALPSIH
ncbi:hypothetical protein QFC20_004172 [Naganishia adeliensis]|uniref:Uncharacterized protein n=1 Tax=Naganishia adeliensis TaxID=92952 RepID=A0ACC2W3U5_9TREE|nr:hypothetical protein QFC20_004172 [Naganishia adeliensis]